MKRYEEYGTRKFKASYFLVAVILEALKEPIGSSPSIMDPIGRVATLQDDDVTRQSFNVTNLYRPMSFWRGEASIESSPLFRA